MFNGIAFVNELYSKYWCWGVEGDCFLDAVLRSVVNISVIVSETWGKLTRHMLLDPRSWRRFGREDPLVEGLIVTDSLVCVSDENSNEVIQDRDSQQIE